MGRYDRCVGLLRILKPLIDSRFHYHHLDKHSFALNRQQNFRSGLDTKSRPRHMNTRTIRRPFFCFFAASFSGILPPSRDQPNFARILCGDRRSQFRKEERVGVKRAGSGSVGWLFNTLAFFFSQTRTSGYARFSTFRP